MGHLLIVATVLLLTQLVQGPLPVTGAEDDWRVSARTGLDKALEYLLAQQEEDGAFGHWRFSSSLLRSIVRSSSPSDPPGSLGNPRRGGCLHS